SPSSIGSAAPYFQHATKRKLGVQVDLLIQCRYCLYICEIKFSPKITPDVIDQVAAKMERLPISKGISVRPVLIYQAELSPKIERANFFTHFISFQDLLK